MEHKTKKEELENKKELQVIVSKSLLEGRKELKKFVPIPECEDKPFQMDDYGNFRIAINSAKGKIYSSWTMYEGIAVVNVGTGLFIGVSNYYEGYLPTERLLRVEEVDEDGESNFFKCKVADLVADKVMGPQEIEEILRDPPFDVEEYGFNVKPASQKDFVKIRITQFGNVDEQDRFLSKEEIIDYIIDTFPAGEFDIFDENDNLINN